MTRFEYLMYSFKVEGFLYKNWVIDLFGLPSLPDKPKVMNVISEVEKNPVGEYPAQLFKNGNNIVFFNILSGQWEVLEGAQPGKIIFRWKDPIELPKFSLSNLKDDIKTTVGNVVVNQVLLCYPFGQSIPFQTGVVSMGKIEAMIAEKLDDLPEDPSAEKDPNKIYTDQLEERFYPAAFAITGWAQISAPAATPYTIVTSPDIKALRLKLLKEYHDQLDDPAIIAKIMKELIDHDKAFQAKDPEKGFLKPGKDFDVVRAKQYLMHGIEYDFTDKSKITVIERSLSEGWDIKKLPEMANSLIDGSFNRGAMTALGGEAAKFLGRFFLNNIISEDDCGSKIGKFHLISGDIQRNFLGMYHLLEDGTTELLTEELLEQYKGKRILLRSPLFCKTVDGNFCVHCMGKRFDNSRNSLGALAIEAGNRMMGIMMSSMHGRALKVEKWDWKTALI